jgi:hypothetical protein
MILEALIYGAILVADLLYIGWIILLTIGAIVDWFDGVDAKMPSEVGFTVAEALSSGNFKVVQGVFNKNTNKVRTGRTMDVSEMDATLDGHHKAHKVVIYD